MGDRPGSLCADPAYVHDTLKITHLAVIHKLYRQSLGRAPSFIFFDDDAGYLKAAADMGGLTIHIRPKTMTENWETMIEATTTPGVIPYKRLPSELIAHRELFHLFGKQPEFPATAKNAGEITQYLSELYVRMNGRLRKRVKALLDERFMDFQGNFPKLKCLHVVVGGSKPKGEPQSLAQALIKGLQQANVEDDDILAFGQSYGVFSKAGYDKVFDKTMSVVQARGENIHKIVFYFTPAKYSTLNENLKPDAIANMLAADLFSEYLEKCRSEGINLPFKVVFVGTEATNEGKIQPGNP
jgi:hypothetical protein